MAENSITNVRRIPAELTERYVEQGWWRGTDACGSTLGAAQTAEERLRQLLAAPVVRCDEIAWSFAGLSMAAWNGVVAAVAGGLALDALRRRLTRIAS